MQPAMFSCLNPTIDELWQVARARQVREPRVESSLRVIGGEL
jgi:hypothetical protein